MIEFNLSDFIQDDNWIKTEHINEFIRLLKDDKVGDLAEFMHDVYESYAKLNGWETQKNCKVKFKDLPEKNKQVMINTALQVIARNNVKIFTLAGDDLIEGRRELK